MSKVRGHDLARNKMKQEFEMRVAEGSRSLTQTGVARTARSISALPITQVSTGPST